MQNLHAEKLQGGFLLSGFFALLGGGYVDNVRSGLLPVIAREMALPLDKTGLFLTLNNLGSFIFTLLIGYALQHRSERSITFFVCVAAVLTTLSAFMVSNATSLFIFGALTGGVAACFGTLCNILTMKGATSELRGRLLTASQMLGALVAISGPLVLTALPFHWSRIIGVSAGFFIVFAFFALRILPSSKQQKLSHPAVPKARTAKKRVCGKYCFVVLIACIYVAAEGLTSAWMVMYTQKAFNFSVQDGSKLLVAFLLMIALSRFLASLFVRKSNERRVLLICLVMGMVFSVIGLSGFTYALPLVGLVGPFFPLFLGRMNDVFPDSWKQVMVQVTLAIQVFIGVCHMLMGNLSERLGIGATYGVIPVLFGVALVLMLLYFHRENRVWNVAPVTA